MNTIAEVKDIFEELDQEFSCQNFYGLQYILDDIFSESIAKPQDNTIIDWYGFDDLNIE
ncbi:MAG: hypothetical protein KAH20_10535 [Methylococcales bacterium]|nr:hypothetical protein [Methylococcales bacterium]